MILLAHYFRMSYLHLGLTAGRLLAAGVGVGFMVVTLVLCLGADLEARIERGLPVEPERTLVVEAAATTPTGGSPEARARFTRRSILDLARLPGVESVTATIRGGPVGLSPASSVPTMVRAVSGSWRAITAKTLAGHLPDLPRLQTEDEGYSGDSSSRACAISQTLSDAVFGAGTSPLGRGIMVFGRGFTVSGVMASSADEVMNGYAAYVPAADLPLQGGTGSVEVTMETAAFKDEVQAVITTYVSANLPGVSRLSIQTASHVFEQALAQGRRASTYSALAASAILVLACVNVANLSWAHVAGRTREIGVRRALGATRGAVVTQAVVECGSIVVVGGLLGHLGAGLIAVVVRSSGFAVSIAPEVVWKCLALLGIATLLISLPAALRAMAVDSKEALWGEP